MSSTESHAEPTAQAPSPSETATDSLRLVLERFEGPLDLLMHLIRVNEIAIAEIPIVEICRQYDEHLQLMQELNLEVAGDYLVMAATLAHIKSRMLLPAPPAGPGAMEEDPRADLVRQLLEHQRVRAAAELLRARDEAEADRFYRGHGGEDPLAPYSGERMLEVSLFDLLSAYKRLVESLGSPARLEVGNDEVSVAEKIAWILERLQRTTHARFEDLLLELKTRKERIAAFLALLELMRLRLIRASQRRHSGAITLSYAGSGETGAGADGGTGGE